VVLFEVQMTGARWHEHQKIHNPPIGTLHHPPRSQLLRRKIWHIQKQLFNPSGWVMASFNFSAGRRYFLQSLGSHGRSSPCTCRIPVYRVSLSEIDLHFYLNLHSLYFSPLSERFSWMGGSPGPGRWYEISFSQIFNAGYLWKSIST
jgi:hypothetical protein